MLMVFMFVLVITVGMFVAVRMSMPFFVGVIM